MRKIIEYFKNIFISLPFPRDVLVNYLGIYCEMPMLKAGDFLNEQVPS